MKLPLPFFGLMIGASALVDLCFWTAAKEARWPDINALVFFALAFAQISLMAAWATIGRTSVYVRVIVAALVIALLSSAIAGIRSGPEEATAFWSITQTVCTMLPLVCLRFAGFALRSPREDPHGSKRLKPWQLSITDLLQMTTAAAVLIAIATLTVPKNRDSFAFWVFVLCYATIFSIPTPAFVFSLLTARSLTVRCIAAVLFAVVNGFVPGILLGRGTAPPEFFTMYFLMQAWVVATLICVRLTGFRFSRFRINGSQPHLSAEQPDGTEATSPPAPRNESS